MYHSLIRCLFLVKTHGIRDDDVGGLTENVLPHKLSRYYVQPASLSDDTCLLPCSMLPAKLACFHDTAQVPRVPGPSPESPTHYLVPPPPPLSLPPTCQNACEKEKEGRNSPGSRPPRGYPVTPSRSSRLPGRNVGASDPCGASKPARLTGGCGALACCVAKAAEATSASKTEGPPACAGARKIT